MGKNTKTKLEAMLKMENEIEMRKLNGTINERSYGRCQIVFLYNYSKTFKMPAEVRRVLSKISDDYILNYLTDDIIKASLSASVYRKPEFKERFSAEKWKEIRSETDFLECVSGVIDELKELEAFEHVQNNIVHRLTTIIESAGFETDDDDYILQ